MNDTPETDKLLTDWMQGVTKDLPNFVEIARRLERERDEVYKIAERAINDLAWFNETNAQRLRLELNQIKEEAK